MPLLLYDAIKIQGNNINDALVILKNNSNNQYDLELAGGGGLLVHTVSGSSTYDIKISDGKIELPHYSQSSAKTQVDYYGINTQGLGQEASLHPSGLSIENAGHFSSRLEATGLYFKDSQNANVILLEYNISDSIGKLQIGGGVGSTLTKLKLQIGDPYAYNSKLTRSELQISGSGGSLGSELTSSQLQIGGNTGSTLTSESLTIGGSSGSALTLTQLQINGKTYIDSSVSQFTNSALQTSYGNTTGMYPIGDIVGYKDGNYTYGVQLRDNGSNIIPGTYFIYQIGRMYIITGYGPGGNSSSDSFFGSDERVSVTIHNTAMNNNTLTYPQQTFKMDLRGTICWNSTDSVRDTRKIPAICYVNNSSTTQITFKRELPQEWADSSTPPVNYVIFCILN